MLRVFESLCVYVLCVPYFSAETQRAALQSGTHKQERAGAQQRDILFWQLMGVVPMMLLPSNEGASGAVKRCQNQEWPLNEVSESPLQHELLGSGSSGEQGGGASSSFHYM